MAQLISTPKLAVLAALLACASAAPLFENTPESGYYGMRRTVAPSSVSVASSAVAAACDDLLADGIVNEFTAEYCDGVGAAAAVSATRTDSNGAMQTADSDSDSSLDPFAFLTLSTMTRVTTVATPLPTLAAPLGEASAPDNLLDFLDDADSVKQQPGGLLDLVFDHDSDDADDYDDNDDGDADASESSSSTLDIDIIAHLNELVNSVKAAASPATDLTSTLSLTQSVTRTAKSATALTATASSLTTPFTAAAASATDAALSSLFDFGSDDSQSSDDNASVHYDEGVQASQYDSADA